MPTSRAQKELPTWVLPVIIGAGVLLIVLLTWRALTGASSAADGPVREVHPGMYDFRKEVQSGNVGRRHAQQGDATR